MSKPFTASDDVVPGEAYAAGYREGHDDALAEQPFNRNAIIEECARIAEDRRWGIHTPLEEIAAAIRALKDET